MVIVDVGKTTSDRETKALITEMEKIGKKGISKESILGDLSFENEEHTLRFLLLNAILDQQAESPTARKSAKFIYDQYGSSLFDDPVKVMKDFQKVFPLDTKKIYRISPAIGRATNRKGWITFRMGGFLIYELRLNENNISLSKKFAEFSKPKQAIDHLRQSKLIQGLLREKAMRMFISWVGHPAYELDVSNGKWKLSDFYMPVNGHVGKVFSRTGILEKTVVETTKEGSNRKDIIRATKLRDPIQEIVSSREADCLAVDHGAYRIGSEFCAENPDGTDCSNCPLQRDCKRNMRWHAY